MIQTVDTDDDYNGFVTGCKPFSCKWLSGWRFLMIMPTSTEGTASAARLCVGGAERDNDHFPDAPCSRSNVLGIDAAPMRFGVPVVVVE
jgi:hypothetical protein